MSLTQNPQTGETHTATIPAIVAAVAGSLVLLAGLFAKKWTGVPLSEAWPVAMFLFTLAGLGLGTMAVKNKNNSL